MNKIDLHSYSICFNSAKQQLKSLLAEIDYSSLFVLMDENTMMHCLPIIADILPEQTRYIHIESGEIHKNLQTCEHIWNTLLEKGADRNSVLINLGGGVIGDMGGFCAATYMRGIRFIQVPTTLLSMVDASVGSKLGVDFQKAKNMIGLFQDPIAVIIDSFFLNTLPQAELRSGFAEVIKHALIRDIVLWKKLLLFNSMDEIDIWDEIIYKSVQIKQKIVVEDPREKGLRKILNFGHTIGHALESHFLDSSVPLLHGEAVAWGMYAEAALSEKHHDLSGAQLSQIQNYIHKIYSDKKPSSWPLDALLFFMRKDKKNVGQKISFSLLSEIGICTPDHFVEESNIEKVLQNIST